MLGLYGFNFNKTILHYHMTLRLGVILCHLQNKPLVVYIFVMLCNDVHNNVVYIMTKSKRFHAKNAIL